MSFDFDKEFNRHFTSTQKSIKRMWVITAIFAILQLAFVLAILGGIVYFIAFAITHWVRW